MFALEEALFYSLLNGAFVFILCRLLAAVSIVRTVEAGEAIVKRITYNNTTPDGNKSTV